VQIALSVSFTNPSEIAFTLEARMFKLGRMLYILIPPLDMFAFLMDIAKVYAPFLDTTTSWEYLYIAFNPMAFPVGADGSCLSRHHAHSRPSCLELLGIL